MHHELASNEHKAPFPGGAKKLYARPELRELGSIESLTAGPDGGSQDMVIFAPGGDDVGIS